MAAGRSIAAILKSHRENAATSVEAPILIHENIRGPGYYHYVGATWMLAALVHAMPINPSFAAISV